MGKILELILSFVNNKEALSFSFELLNFDIENIEEEINNSNACCIPLCSKEDNYILKGIFKNNNNNNLNKFKIKDSNKKSFLVTQSNGMYSITEKQVVCNQEKFVFLKRIDMEDFTFKISYRINGMAITNKLKFKMKDRNKKNITPGLYVTGMGVKNMLILPTS